VLVGALFILMFFFIIKNLEKLAENNSFKINDTLNQTAEVYLSIPEHKSGKGKVMISVKGSFHELEAITEHDRIPTGAVVKVVRIENNTILVVETL
jgi:membrane protein implicated in regulation of membrane protease activity